MAGGLDLVSLQDAITAEVKRIAPNTQVEEDSIPDDEALPRDANGKVVPCIVLRYSPLGPGYGKSFGGPRHDEYVASFDVMTIATSGRVSRILNAAIVSHLIGFKPDGVSPIHQRSDAGTPSQFTVSSNEIRPTLYVVSTRLRFAVNNTNIGAAVPILP